MTAERYHLEPTLPVGSPGAGLAHADENGPYRVAVCRGRKKHVDGLPSFPTRAAARAYARRRGIQLEEKERDQT